MKKLLHHGLLAILLNGLFAIVGPIVESAWYVMRLSAMPVPQHYFFPVEGVRAAALRDSWQAPRDGGRRTHEGIDIFAPRGTPIRATTEGVVLRTGQSRRGGNLVWILGPGGHRHYYAHLDRFAGLVPGQRIKAGCVIGYVGNSGNARGTPPHLHYGIYSASGPYNPYPLLKPGNA